MDNETINFEEARKQLSETTIASSLEIANASTIRQSDIEYSQHLNQVRQLESQETATSLEKTKAYFEQWQEGTVLGQLTKSKVNKEDFVKEEGFQRISPLELSKIGSELGLTTEEQKKLAMADSTQEYHALYQEAKTNSSKREMLGNILTSDEQFYGSLATSLIDYDFMASVALTGGFGIGFKALKTGVLAQTATKLAMTSSVISATHPFVMNGLKDEHRDMESMVQESLLRGAIEGIASKLFIPTIKAEVSQAISEITDVPLIARIDSRIVTPEIPTLNMKPAPIETKPIVEPTPLTTKNTLVEEFRVKDAETIAKDIGSDAEYAQMVKDELQVQLDNFGHLVKNDDEFFQKMTNKDYDWALDYLAKKTEGMTAPKTEIIEKFPRPKGMDEQIIDMIETDLVASSKAEFDKVGFGATISGYANASKTFSEFVDGMKNYLRENSFDIEKITTASKAIRVNAKQLLDDVEGMVGLTKQEKKLFSDVLNREVDDMLDIAKAQDGLLNKTEAKAIAQDTASRTKQFIDRIRQDRDMLFQNITKTAQKTITELNSKYDDLLKEVKRIEDKLDAQTSGVKAKGKVTDTTLEKAQESASKAKQAMDDAIEKEIEKITKDVGEKNAKQVRLVKDGDGYKFGKYKIPTAIAIGAFGTNAMAGDGTGDFIIGTAEQLFTLAVLAGLGRYAYKSGILGSVASHAFKGAEQGASAMKKAWVAKQNFQEAMKGDMMWLRTRFSGTYAPIVKYASRVGNEELKNLTDKLLFNGMKGSSDTVEVAKKTFLHEMSAKYMTMENDLFSKWLSANGLSWKDYIKSTLDGYSLRTMFREIVSDVKDGARSVESAGSEFVKQMASHSKSLYDETIKRLEELGVDGVEQMKKVNGYVSRRFSNKVRELLVDASPEDLLLIKDKFKTMYRSAVASSKKELDGISMKLKTVLDKMDTMDSFKSFVEKNEKTLRLAVTDDSEMADLLESFLKSTTVDEAKSSYKLFAQSIDDLTNEAKIDSKISKYIENLKKDGYANSVADVMAPLKHRVPLDMKAYGEPMWVGFRGGKKEIKLNDLFERDDYELFSKYTSSAGGRLALKQAGYQVDDAKGIIDRIGDETVKTEMDSVLKATLGNPIVNDLTEHSAKLIQGMGNIASGTLLAGLSAIMTIQELGMAVGRAMRYNTERGLVFQHLGDIAHDIFKNTGRDSAFVNVFAENTGTGLSSKSGMAHMRGETHGSLEDFSSGGYLYNMTKTYRDTIITGRGFGIARYADALEKINGLMNLQRLTEMVHLDKEFAPFLMEKYGVSIEDRVFLKRVLGLNEKGYAKQPLFESMNTSERLKYQTILFNMNQFGAQIGTMGTTPQVLYASSIGSTFAKVMSYPINSIENLGMPMLKGMFNGDADSYIALASSYMGAYVAVKMKAMALGREEKDDEYYHSMAVMNMPFMAPAGIMHAVINPTVPSGLERFAGTMMGSHW